jgi:hypothetical protein
MVWAIPFFGMLIPMVIVPVALYFKHQRERLWHETARIALEKGQPVPLVVGDDEQAIQAPRPRNDLRAGLILIAVSVGLMLQPWRFDGVGHSFNPIAFGAAIPGCIGVALLLNASITALLSKKNTDANRKDPAASLNKS